MNQTTKPDKDYPLVSVVTPSFNSMQFVKETIESVKNQDYPNIEHVIVDGNSSDGTKELLKQYGHLKWISEPDKGQSEAINKGFKMAKGEIIGWLNSDDTYEPGAVSFAVDCLVSNPGADIICTDVRIIDEKGDMLRIAKAEPFSIERLLESNVVKQPTVFMRKKVIEAIGGLREDLHYVMDQEFWFRAGLKFKFDYIPGRILANFRFCQGTKSKESPIEFMVEWKEVLRNFADHEAIDDETRSAVKKAERLAERSYCFGMMTRAARSRNRLSMLGYMIKGLLCRWSSIFDPAIWKLFLRTALKPDVEHDPATAGRGKR